MADDPRDPPGIPADPSEASPFDRVRPPDPRRPHRGDLQGKRALYSVDPEANPTPVLVVTCPHCDVERPVTAAGLPGLLRPPWLLNPCRRSLWTRCPTCRRRSWLGVRLGPGLPQPIRSILPWILSWSRSSSSDA